MSAGGTDRGRADLVASALDAIVSIDAEDRIVEFNPSAEQTFGFRREDVLGRSLTDVIVPPAQRGAHRAGVRRVAEGGPFHVLGKRLELTAVHANGIEFPVELAITQTSSDPFRVTAFVRDLSAEHAARDALIESEARYAHAFDQAPLGIALVSLDPASAGRLLRVNEALCRMTGYPEIELLEKSFGDITHPDDLAADQARFQEVLAGERKAYQIEKRFLRSDGVLMWGLVHCTVARDADDQPLYGIGQVEDITFRKAAEEALRASEQRLTRTERLARIGAWEWDRARDRLSWSGGLDSVFGPYSEARAPSLEAFLSIVHPDDRTKLGRLIQDVLDGRAAQTWEYRILSGEGVVHVFSWGEVVRSDDGTTVGMQGYAQDVTAHRLAEERADGLRRDHDLILEAAGEGIFRVDAEGCTTYVNPAAARLLGYEASELTGQPVHDLIHHSRADGTEHPWRECPMRLSIARGETRRVADDVLWRKDGTQLPVEYTVAPTRAGDRVTGAVIVFSDVAERREMEDRLREFADTDALTGLINRRRFEDTVTEHLTDRRGGGALLLLDLDHFKFVNDSFGHAAGDDLIRAIARVLTEQVRNQDVLARLGGDEFAVLLPGADAKEAAQVARRLAAGIESARPCGLLVGASVGATCFDGTTGAEAGDLLVSADIALYEAKKRGRGRVEFFAGQPGTSLTWVERIRAALEEDRFVLYAQPIIDLGTGQSSQDELLIRMVDDTGAVIPPVQFLPTAEAFGLMGDIDRWVLRRGIEFAASGRRVHINLSGRSVGSQPFLDELSELLQSTSADPADVIFELTETAAIANIVDARAFAHSLQTLGCRLALDDFGTGFGSFTYLRNLPADYLKIDMEFVRGMGTSQADRRVVESIVGVARRFGQRTVAEGVEDERVLALLREVGVDYAQGYHLGRPAPAQAGQSSWITPVTSSNRMVATADTRSEPAQPRRFEKKNIRPGYPDPDGQPGSV